MRINSAIMPVLISASSMFFASCQKTEPEPKGLPVNVEIDTIQKRYYEYNIIVQNNNNIPIEYTTAQIMMNNKI